MKLLLFIFLVPSIAFAQTFPNLINHTLESIPEYFVKVPTQKSDGIYRALPNLDFNNNNYHYRIRSYLAPKISKNIRLSCLYVQYNKNWVCIGARFFSWMEKKDGYGTIGDDTENILYNFINFSGDKPGIQSEWQKIDGVSVSGNPKWASAFLAGREYYYFAALDPEFYNTPIKAIDIIIKIFNTIVDNPNQVAADPKTTANSSSASQSIPKSIDNLFALPNVYIRSIYK